MLFPQNEISGANELHMNVICSDAVEVPAFIGGTFHCTWRIRSQRIAREREKSRGKSNSIWPHQEEEADFCCIFFNADSAHHGGLFAIFAALVTHKMTYSKFYSWRMEYTFVHESILVGTCCVNFQAFFISPLRPSLMATIRGHFTSWQGSLIIVGVPRVRMSLNH